MRACRSGFLGAEPAGGGEGFALATLSIRACREFIAKLGTTRREHADAPPEALLLSSMGHKRNWARLLPTAKWIALPVRIPSLLLRETRKLVSKQADQTARLVVRFTPNAFCANDQSLAVARRDSRPDRLCGCMRNSCASKAGDVITCGTGSRHICGCGPMGFEIIEKEANVVAMRNSEIYRNSACTPQHSQNTPAKSEPSWSVATRFVRRFR